MRRFMSKSTHNLNHAQNEGVRPHSEGDVIKERFHEVTRGAAKLKEGGSGVTTNRKGCVVFSGKGLKRGELIQLKAVGKGDLTVGYTLAEPTRRGEEKWFFKPVTLQDGDLLEVEHGPGKQLRISVNSEEKGYIKANLNDPFIAYKIESSTLGLYPRVRLQRSPPPPPPRPKPPPPPRPTSLDLRSVPELHRLSVLCKELETIVRTHGLNSPASSAGSSTPVRRPAPKKPPPPAPPVPSAPPFPPSAPPLPTVIPSDECSVCFESNVDSVLDPCGHICMCYNCASTISHTSKLCPVCRQTISKVIKTFKV